MAKYRVGGHLVLSFVLMFQLSSSRGEGGGGGLCAADIYVN